MVEIASNDGYLLRNFVAKGVPVLGIDPAEAPARAAIEADVPTLNTFFGLALARELREQGRMADLILANNVLAHVADLNGLVEGIATLLKPTGMAVLEMPYLVDLIERHLVSHVALRTCLQTPIYRARRRDIRLIIEM